MRLVSIGISTRPTAMRSLKDIQRDILELEREADGLMAGILGSDGQ